MGDSNFRGPVTSMGSLEAEYTAVSTVASIEPTDGPSGFYQGLGMLDPRSFPINKDGLLPGRIPAFITTPDWVTLDVVPQAASSTVIAAAQVPATAGSALALVTVPTNVQGTTAAGIALGVPILPAGTTVVTTAPIAIDFGFTVGTTTGLSTAIAVPDNTLFTMGQWLIVGNVANAAGTASLVTQVMSIGTTATGVLSTANLTTLTVSPAPQTTLFAPIGAANLWGSNLLPASSQFGPVNSTATAISKTLQAGLLRVHNPREQSSRCLSVAAISSAGGTSSFKITSYDVWLNPMTELFTASGTTVIYGQKAHKYIMSVNIVTTGAASASIGIGDTFGLPVRADEFPQISVLAGTAWGSNSAGFTAATTVAPTNNTAGDVRGTIQISALGAGTPIANVATTNGTSRLFITQTPAVDRIIACTPNNTVPLFGIAQSTS